MSASVSITTQKKENIIVIPLQSITTRRISEDSLKYIGNTIQQVFAYDKTTGKVNVLEIGTGIQDMTKIEVTRGLDTSCRIVTAPYSAISRDLKEGSVVTPQK